MPATSFLVEANTVVSLKQQYVFVVQFKDGTYGVGTHTNPSKRIAAINSGHHPSVSKKLQVYRIVGVKPMDENRNTISTVQKLSNKVGAEKVIAL